VARVLGGLRSAFDAVRPLPEEVKASRPGDQLIAEAQVVMDRAFTLEGSLETVWPWLVQLGKKRAGWYLPRAIERVIPPPRRALRAIDPSLQQLAVGDVIPDWGGRSATFEVAELRPPRTLVYRSRRGQTNLSWTINLESPSPAATRVHLRLRMAPVKRQWLAKSAGELVDLSTVAGLAAGLRERLAAAASPS
jgi:hypothetical protein